MDGVIPLGKLGEVLAAISQICDSHGLRVANIFHAGDGNLHPLVLYDANNADEAERAEQRGRRDPRAVRRLGGCLTGEHGVGIEKRDLMRVQFTETDLALQMRVKTRVRPEVAAESGQGVSARRPQGRRWKPREGIGRVLTNMRPVDEREFSRLLAEADGNDDADRAGRRRLQGRRSGGR